MRGRTESELEALLAERRRLERVFNEVTDEALVDAVIFEINSIERKIGKFFGDERLKEAA